MKTLEEILKDISPYQRTNAERDDITVERLMGYGFKSIKGEITTRVNSRPHTISYGGGVFYGSFIFSQNALKRIILRPIISGVKIPNYPSEEYQKTKEEYCVSILRSIYGKETASDSTGTYWEKDDITIGCSIILEGRDEYTGGNIIIDLGD